MSVGLKRRSTRLQPPCSTVRLACLSVRRAYHIGHGGCIYLCVGVVCGIHAYTRAICVPSALLLIARIPPELEGFDVKYREKKNPGRLSRATSRCNLQVRTRGGRFLGPKHADRNMTLASSFSPGKVAFAYSSTRSLITPRQFSLSLSSVSSPILPDISHAS